MQPSFDAEAFLAWMIRIGGYDRAAAVAAFALALPGAGCVAAGRTSGSE